MAAPARPRSEDELLSFAEAHLRPPPPPHDAPQAIQAEALRDLKDIEILLLDMQSNYAVARPLARDQSEEAEAERMAAFSAWVSQVDGVDMSRVELHAGFPEGNGLRALADIDEGDTVLVVPNSLMMTEETAHASDSLKGVTAADPFCRQVPLLTLALHLLAEAFEGDQSPWAAYIDILPTDFSIPMFWTVEEMEALAGTTAYVKTVRGLYNTMRQYLYAKGLCHKNRILRNRMSWANFRWAMGVAFTRQNLVPRQPLRADAAPNQYAFIPLWDMCNHTTTGDIQSFAEDDVMTCAAVMPFSAGDQVFIYYGDRGAADFLVFSGFVPADNRKDYVHVILEQDENDPLYPAKQVMLAQLGFKRHMYAPAGADGEIDPNVLSFLRIKFLDAEEAREHDKVTTPEGVSPRNEIAALTHWHEVLAAQYNRLPDETEATNGGEGTSTAAAGDDGGEVSFKKLSAALLLASERVCLLHHIDLARAALQKRGAAPPLLHGKRKKKNKKKKKKKKAAATAAAGDGDGE